MGPGLFLLLAVLAGGARAEISVGLDARGVDPMAAVDNRQGLDVRDELGRPVSGQAVLSELKKAQAVRAVETAYATALPKARTVLAALEYSLGRGLSLVRFSGLPALATVWATFPAPKPKVSALLFALLGVVLTSSAAVLRPRVMQVCLKPCQRCPEVLRC